MTRKDLHERARWCERAALEMAERTEDESVRELLEELARVVAAATRPGS